MDFTLLINSYRNLNHAWILYLYFPAIFLQSTYFSTRYVFSPAKPGTVIIARLSLASIVLNS